MSKILLASHRRLFTRSMRIGKKTIAKHRNDTRWASACFSTQIEEEEVPVPLESFLNGTSTLYAEQMYEMYLEDPASVQDSWRTYFENEANEVPFDSNDFNKPTSVPGKRSAAVAGVC